MSHLEWQGHRFVYTGDVTFASRLIEEPCAELVGEAMIIDGSYGVRSLPREAAEERLLSLIRLATDAMLSNGPVTDHLHALAGSPHNLVVLTGYQAPGTPGRRLAEGEVEIETPRGWMIWSGRYG